MTFIAKTRLLTGAAALGILALAAPAIAEPATITIVHVNDLDRMEEDDGQGGVARLAGAIAEIKAGAEHVLVTNGGDAISPSLLSGFDKGAHMVDLYNMVGFDAVAVGNHEFDFGPAVLEERAAEANYPLLSANALDTDGEPVDGTQANMMVEIAGYTLGIYGLTTPDTAVKSSPGDVTFGNPVDVGLEQAAMLREQGADIVVAVAHTHLGEDAEMFGARVADVILSGDDHVMQVRYDGKTLLIESRDQANYVMVVDLTVDTVEGRRGPQLVWEPSVRTINTKTVTPDATVQAKVDEYLAFLSAELDVELGTTETEIDSRRASVRGGETAIGNLITDAMREATGADVALTNGGGIRADKIYTPGTVLTRRDIQSELPFGNKTVSIEVSGADILAALENGFSRIEDVNGRFPHVSGMSVVYNPSAEAGTRVIAVEVGGETLDLAETYTLATNDFMGAGGDGYGMFAGKPRVIDANSARLMAAQVMDYIAAAGTISPAVEGRLTIKQ